MPMQDAAREIGVLMAGFRAGRKDSADRLFELLYPELRRLAAARMRRERPEHSWQPTLLVNELYLELARRKALGGNGAEGAEERAAFLGLAGFLMKRLLILHSRPLHQRITHVNAGTLEETPTSLPSPEDLRHIDDLLDRLGKIDPRLRTVVELRVFEGKSHEEISAQLGCSVRTVGSCWSFARKWLASEMSRPDRA